MQDDIEFEISLRGRDRTLLLPRVGLHNVAPALERLDWLRRLRDIDQAVADKAEAALNAISNVGAK